MDTDSGLPHSEMQVLFQFGDELIGKTRELILNLWRKNQFNTELKADTSPVTEVDYKTEEMVREAISKKFPDHGIIGEEFDDVNPDSEFQWTIDPIDGTQNLIHRIPTFGTLLGLRYRGEAVIGFIDHPALNVCCKGGLGLGVFCNGEPQRIEDLSPQLTELPANEIIATSTLATFQRNNHGGAFEKILKFHPNIRIYYDCYQQTLAACGNLGAVVEFNLRIWDLTPIEALAREAGGRYRSIGGPSEHEGATLYNAVFGKPKAVELISRLFG